MAWRNRHPLNRRRKSAREESSKKRRHRNGISSMAKWRHISNGIDNEKHISGMAKKKKIMAKSGISISIKASISEKSK